MRKEEDSQITEELEAILPSDLQEALLTFDGDFRGPWLALGLEADADLHSDEIRRAYRQAVRSEHPDASDFPDADERFERVRQAYAILKDGGWKSRAAFGGNCPGRLQLQRVEFHGSLQ